MLYGTLCISYLSKLHVGGDVYLHADAEDIGTIAQASSGEDYEVVEVVKDGLCSSNRYWALYGSAQATGHLCILEDALQAARLKRHTPYYIPYPGGFVKFMKDKLINMKSHKLSNKEKASVIRKMWDEMVVHAD